MLKKMVDGKEVICSAEEEASIRAEWAANDPSLKSSSNWTAADAIINDPKAIAALKAALAK
jgi:hypothetical protein